MWYAVVAARKCIRPHQPTSLGRGHGLCQGTDSLASLQLVAKVYDINPHPHWEIFLTLLCFLFCLHLYWCAPQPAHCTVQGRCLPYLTSCAALRVISLPRPAWMPSRVLCCCCGHPGMCLSFVHVPASPCPAWLCCTSAAARLAVVCSVLLAILHSKLSSASACALYVSEKAA